MLIIHRSLEIHGGSLHTGQISHLLLYPSLWLLVLGLSSHICYCFLYNLLLRSVLASDYWPVISLGNDYEILYVSGTPQYVHVHVFSGNAVYNP